MTNLRLAGIGFRGPGADSWAEASERLRVELPPLNGARPSGLGTALPPAERRRATPATRLAIDVAMEALGSADPAKVTSIFTSSGGEAGITHSLLLTLCERSPQVSPTAFHHSVHNTASGYFGITSRSRLPSDSLCAFDDSLGAGLAECVLRRIGGEDSLLLVAFDLSPPYPILPHRPIHDDMAVALYFSSASESPLANLEIDYVCPSSRRNTLPPFSRNPLECGYPLLLAVAKQRPEEVFLSSGLGGGQLHIRVTPG